MFKTIKEAMLVVGGSLSEPSKMPCFGFSIPAQKCITGAKLRKVVNSVCSKCYALKGRYVFGNIKTALMRRYDALNHPQWVNAMAFMIAKREKSGFFRWHDSGDLQSVEHLQNIVKVCELTPHIRHWIPTREYVGQNGQQSIVAQWFAQYGKLPENLTMRLSALMLEGAAPTAIAQKYGLTTSGVSKTGFTCPSVNQGGKCLDCRACWNKEIANVNYKQH